MSRVFQPYFGGWDPDMSAVLSTVVLDMVPKFPKYENIEVSDMLKYIEVFDSPKYQNIELSDR